MTARAALLVVAGWLAGCGAKQVPPPPAQASSTEPFTFESKGLTLEGVLHAPAGEGPFPGLVLVHGSGPNSRDAALPGQLNMGFGFRIAVFAELAIALADRGYVVVRYDKRSCGRFNDCFENAYPTPSDDLVADIFVDDALAGAAALRNDPRVDGARVVVVGHSQGGSFVPEMLTRDPKLVAGVMLAPTHSPIDAVLQDQTSFSERLLDDSGAPKLVVDQALKGLRKTNEELARLRAGEDVPDTLGGAPTVFWRSFLRLTDEAPARAAALERPLLVVGGGYDWNVPPKEIDAWRATLAPRGEIGHRVESLECVTHALNCVAQPEYSKIKKADIGPHVDERVAPLIDEFLSSL